MGKLIYSAIASLDGDVADADADADGSFDSSAPDEEVHAFVNDLERPVGTYLLGRRMYEVLAVWEHAADFDDHNPVIRDYAEIWQAADKSCTRRRSTRSRAPGRGSSGASSPPQSAR